mmetsp:Transcript_19494/g.53415  ORF Transcript_19494/g.53415 Transcript_19494/m.53415 type:complete len:154 (-) Transcript_19494:67-528(-)
MKKAFMLLTSMSAFASVLLWQPMSASGLGISSETFGHFRFNFLDFGTFDVVIVFVLFTIGWSLICLSTPELRVVHKKAVEHVEAQHCDLDQIDDDSSESEVGEMNDITYTAKPYNACNAAQSFGFALLERYGVFGANPGDWSNPLFETSEVSD